MDLYYSRLWILLGGAGFYLLGAAVIIFLGPGLDWNIFWLGLACVFFLILSSTHLRAHFDQIDVLARGKRMIEAEPETEGLIRIPRQFFLLTSLTTLTTGAVITVLLMIRYGLSVNTYLLLGIAFLVAIFYGVPPFRLVYSGLGELSQTVLLAVLIPALAYSFQIGEMNRLLSMLTFPLAALLLALYLAQSFEGYGKKRFLQRGMLLERLGWQRAAFWHNFLLLSAYLLVAVAAIAGLPWPITWPALLSLPIALFQILQMAKITAGAKPRWQLLRLTSFVTVASTLYFVIITLITG